MKTPVQVIVMLLAASLAGAGQEAFRLARVPQVNQETRYRMTAEIDLLGTPATFSALVVERVVAVEGGRYTIESVQKDATARHGDKEQRLPDSPPARAIYLLSGDPVEVKSENAGGMHGRLARMGAIIAPGKEVKVGDSWSHEFAASPLSGGVGGKGSYKLLSTEKRGLRDVAVVQFSFKETSGKSPAESVGKAWLDAATGELVKLESDWKNAPMMSADAPLNAKITLEREG